MGIERHQRGVVDRSRGLVDIIANIIPQIYAPEEWSYGLVLWFLSLSFSLSPLLCRLWRHTKLLKYKLTKELVGVLEVVRELGLMNPKLINITLCAQLCVLIALFFHHGSTPAVVDKDIRSLGY